MHTTRVGLLLAAALALTGCTTSSPAASRSARVPRVETQLFLGASIEGRPGVTAADWQEFLAEVVTPRFPAGLTVVPARGQWQSGTGEISSEETRILILVHDGDAHDESALAAITAEYISRFRQESVLRVDRRVQVTLAVPAPAWEDGGILW